MHAIASKSPWLEDLEKTVVRSLTTSFGLDFLLLQDRHGGNVDTINNARQGVYATSKEQDRYEHRELYNPDKYHNADNYASKGAADAKLQASGNLTDSYTRKTMPAKKGIRDLDHTISAKSIDDDPGRVLAELSGPELANHRTNLNSTHRSVNRSKKALSVTDFLDRLPGHIANEQNAQERDKKRLANLPRNTPEQSHKAHQLEDRIKQRGAKIRELQAVDPAAMRKKDRTARKQYEGTISRTYYSSSKFWGNTIQASGSAGVQVGTRQMLGLIAAEIWFELREALPAMIKKLSLDFSLEVFLDHVRATLAACWTRIQRQFKEFLTAFKDGMFGGILSSLTTTLLNIFATTAKNAIKVIREMWTQLVSAIKLWMFNPDKLSSAELGQAVLGLLSAGVAAAIGSLVYAQLLPVLGFPFGTELAAFAGALVTSLVTMGLHHFLTHSSMMRKVWEFLDRSSHALTLRQFEVLNAQLDEYLTEIARIDLNIDTDGLELFAADLGAAQTEAARGVIIARAVEKEGISLPFEMGNTASTRRWLASLAK
ncbi:hypothetical protein [Achromobacter dolens]|uniref:hypothetical protein n=1 Tax=Achromobacter TaxID=222 RepID=UPI000AD124F5|nr:hypothetical protein [Achromobacter dolens]